MKDLNANFNFFLQNEEILTPKGVSEEPLGEVNEQESDEAFVSGDEEEGFFKSSFILKDEEYCYLSRRSSPRGFTTAAAGECAPSAGRSSSQGCNESESFECIPMDYDEELEDCLLYYEEQHPTLCGRREGRSSSPYSPALCHSMHCGGEVCSEDFELSPAATLLRSNSSFFDENGAGEWESHEDGLEEAEDSTHFAKEKQDWLEKMEEQVRMPVLQWLAHQKMFLGAVARHVLSLCHSSNPLAYPVLPQARELLISAVREMRTLEHAVHVQHPEWISPMAPPPSTDGAEAGEDREPQEQPASALVLKPSEWSVRCCEVAIACSRLSEMYTMLLVPLVPVKVVYDGGALRSSPSKEVPSHTSLPPLVEERIARQRAIIDQLSSAGELFLSPPVIPTPRTFYPSATTARPPEEGILDKSMSPCRLQLTFRSSISEDDFLSASQWAEEDEEELNSCDALTDNAGCSKMVQAAFKDVRVVNLEKLGELEEVECESACCCEN